MVKVIVEIEIPDMIFGTFCGLYPANTEKHLEKLIRDHNTWGVKAKILEWPEKKTLDIHTNIVLALL